jgi:gas vesicle protein
MSNKKAVKSFLWGTLTGAITGAVTALLFAPKTGRELRGDIAQTAQKVGEKTADLSRQAGSAVQSLAKKTSNLVTDIRARKLNASIDTEEVAATEESYEDNKPSVQ